MPNSNDGAVQAHAQRGRHSIRCCDASGAGSPDAPGVSGVNRGGLFQHRKHVLRLRTTRVIRVNLCIEDPAVLSDHVTGGHRQCPGGVVIEARQIVLQALVEIDQVIRQGEFQAERLADFAFDVCRYRSPGTRRCPTRCPGAPPQELRLATSAGSGRKAAGKTFCKAAIFGRSNLAMYGLSGCRVR
jgi:hypothetical protein